MIAKNSGSISVSLSRTWSLCCRLSKYREFQSSRFRSFARCAREIVELIGVVEFVRSYSSFGFLVCFPREVQFFQKTNSTIHLVFGNASGFAAMLGVIFVRCSHSRYPTTKSAGLGGHIGYRRGKDDNQALGINEKPEKLMKKNRSTHPFTYNDHFPRKTFEVD